MTEELEEEDRRYDESAKIARRTLSDAVIRRPIRRLESNPPLSVPAGAPVAQAIKAMYDGGVGCCLVTRPDGLIAGILSERDVMNKVFARGQNPASVKVDQVMTPNPDALTLEDTVGTAMNKMALGGYRHVPLVDDHRKPVGILSVRTILRYLADYFPQDVINLPPHSDADIGRARDGA